MSRVRWLSTARYHIKKGDQLGCKRRRKLLQNVFLIQTTAYCRESFVAKVVKSYLKTISYDIPSTPDKYRTLQAKRYMDFGEQGHSVMGFWAITLTLGSPWDLSGEKIILSVYRYSMSAFHLHIYDR
jgi:hypothetical protein